MKKAQEEITATHLFLEDELQSAANKLKRPIDRVRAKMGDSNGVLLLCLDNGEMHKMVEWAGKCKNTIISFKPGKARISGTSIEVVAIPIMTKRGKK